MDEKYARNPLYVVLEYYLLLLELANFQPVDIKAVKKSSPPKATDMQSLIEALPLLPDALEVQEKKSKHKRGPKNAKRSL